MSLEVYNYIFNPVYQTIGHRFFKLNEINISSHIQSVETVSWRPQEGFYFIAKNPSKLIQALQSARFQLDSRERSFGFLPSIGFFAALVTESEGYRERSAGVMLHCAISNDLCNIQLDDTAFVLEGYNANMAQHVADDLIWQTGIVANVSVPFAKILGRVHSIVPNLRQFKPLSEIGAQFDLYSRRSDDERILLKLTVDATHSCSDLTCGALKALDGQAIEGDNKVMVKLNIIGL